MDLRRIGIAMLLLALAPAASGWSQLGHRLVGEQAQRLLSPAVHAEVAALLRGEPDPSLAGVSVWADKVRDLPGFAWSEPLHYVRINDRGCNYDPARDCRDGECVVAAITRYQSRLADPTLPRVDRIEALKFLVHFVGDVHQPLHAGYRNDRGGNQFQVNIAGEGTNLHRVWDYFVLDRAQRSFEQWIGQLESLPETTVDLKPARWAEASCRLTQEASGLYPQRPGRLPRGYLAAQRPLAELRLRAAAIQLAAMIEQALVARP